MSAQLWEIELDGPVVSDQHKIVAPRGRLVQHVSGWPALGGALAEWAVWRVRDHVTGVLDEIGDATRAGRLGAADRLDDALAAVASSEHDPTSAAGVAVAQLVDAINDLANPIVACHDAARAAGHAATITERSINVYKAAFAAERLAQSRWIADQLNLID
jgi:hypothetical protein